jgi:ABC-type ATPase with predicted acetyltransferase domain
MAQLAERPLAPLTIRTSAGKLSVHAPSKFEKEREKEIVGLLSAVASRGWRIVLHPDAIRDVALWNSFGPLLLIENMDKRNICGRTERELSEIFARLPEAGPCFDIGQGQFWDEDANRPLKVSLTEEELRFIIDALSPHREFGLASFHRLSSHLLYFRLYRFFSEIEWRSGVGDVTLAQISTSAAGPHP